MIRKKAYSCHLFLTAASPEMDFKRCSLPFMATGIPDTKMMKKQLTKIQSEREVSEITGLAF